MRFIKKLSVGKAREGLARGEALRSLGEGGSEIQARGEIEMVGVNPAAVSASRYFAFSRACSSLSWSAFMRKSYYCPLVAAWNDGPTGGRLREGCPGRSGEALEMIDLVI
jgi:hypothetical protein